jgi:uncharacterized protein (TIGR03067 family)
MRKGIFFFIGVSIATVVVGCQKPSVSTGNGNEGSGDGNQSDRDRLQGVWLFESIDTGDAKMKMEKSRDARIQFQGDKVIITESKNDSGEWFSMSLDTTKEPKWMTLKRLDSSGNPLPQTLANANPINEEWIYKFDGDALNIAIGAPIDPWKSSRPTDFKAQAWVVPKNGQAASPSVMLWHLKKTDEPVFKPAPAKPHQKDLLKEKLNQEILWNGGNLNELTLAELLGKLSKDYGVTFVIMEEDFKKEGVLDIKTQKPKFAAVPLRELKLGLFLDFVLVSMNAKYLIRPDYIEITTLSSAMEKTKADMRPKGN